MERFPRECGGWRDERSGSVRSRPRLWSPGTQVTYLSVYLGLIDGSTPDGTRLWDMGFISESAEGSSMAL